MSLLMKAAIRAEKLIYRIGGLPVALRKQEDSQGACGDVIRRAYARDYWRPGSVGGWVEIVAAWLLWPVVLFGGAVWFTANNGPFIRRRDGRSPPRQFADQVKLYFTSGLLSPWYYIFELARTPTPERASAFLQRFESKAGIYALLRRGVTSELNNKKVFADYCAEQGVRCVPYLFALDGSEEPPVGALDCDLFVKPVDGRGGRGAERWDRIAPGRLEGPGGLQLSDGELIEWLNARAKEQPLLVQRRVAPHPAVTDLTSGALPSVRVTTCLNEEREPEVMSAVFRMAIGANRTVDNLHAGGIAAGVDLDAGTLSSASNLGMESRLGWLERHPDTGAEIVGRKLPLWDETKALAVQAHRAFSDRVLVGWDIGVTEEGPLVVEGNSSPDLDIVQRFGPPVCATRFGELLAWHLVQRGFA